MELNDVDSIKWTRFEVKSTSTQQLSQRIGKFFNQKDEQNSKKDEQNSNSK